MWEKLDSLLRKSLLRVGDSRLKFTWPESTISVNDNSLSSHQTQQIRNVSFEKLSKKLQINSKKNLRSKMDSFRVANNAFCRFLQVFCYFSHDNE